MCAGSDTLDEVPSIDHPLQLDGDHNDTAVSALAAKQCTEDDKQTNFKLEKREQWDQWSWSMKYRIRAENPEYAKLIDEAENTAEKDLENLKMNMGDVDNGEKRAAELYGILSDKVTGEANRIYHDGKDFTM